MQNVGKATRRGEDLEDRLLEFAARVGKSVVTAKANQAKPKPPTPK